MFAGTPSRRREPSIERLAMQSLKDGLSNIKLVQADLAVRELGGNYLCWDRVSSRIIRLDSVVEAHISLSLVMQEKTHLLFRSAPCATHHYRFSVQALCIHMYTPRVTCVRF